MKAISGKILIFCLAVCLPTNIISAQKRAVSEKYPSGFWQPKVKTEKMVGEIIAYKGGGICIDLCPLFTIFKLENPIGERRFVKINFAYVRGDFPKAFVGKRRKIEINVFEIPRVASDETAETNDNKGTWSLIKGAENEIMTYGSGLPIYYSTDSPDKIKN
jgi:hypothetical protein